MMYFTTWLDSVECFTDWSKDLELWRRIYIQTHSSVGEQTFLVVTGLRFSILRCSSMGKGALLWATAMHAPSLHCAPSGIGKKSFSYCVRQKSHWQLFIRKSYPYFLLKEPRIIILNHLGFTWFDWKHHWTVHCRLRTLIFWSFKGPQPHLCCLDPTTHPEVTC